jgi:hypothetical protein
MKLLYVCGTYAPGAFAGSELSAHELLRELQEISSVDVLVVTESKYTGGIPGKLLYNGVQVQGVSHEQRRESLEEIFQTYRPDVVLTQLMWSDVAIQTAKKKNVPTVLRIPSAAANLDIESPTALVANSRFICEWAHRRSGRKCHYITSVIDLERVVAPKELRAPRFVTMFNPIKNKGGSIFREVAEAMPMTEFAFVPGWHSLRNSDGTWNVPVIKAGLESQNADRMDWLPEEVDLSGLENVKRLQPRENVAEIYAQTRILLVPSQYQETLARVSIEGLANGIPVLGSAVGGLQDHIRRAGVLISDFANPAAWVEAIKRLDDPGLYERYSVKALRYIAEDFANERTVQEFLSLFEEVVGSRN